MNDDSASAIILALFISLWAFQPKANIEDVSAYYRYCPDLRHNSFSCPDSTKVMRIQYRLFLNQQIMVSEGLTKNANCIIFDKENWSCEDGINTIGMRNGTYFETLEGNSIDGNGEKSTLPLYQDIPAIVYHIQKVIIFVKGIFS